MVRALHSQSPVTFESVQFTCLVLFCYLLYMFLATKYLPGKHVLGSPDSKGKRLRYKVNGLQLHILTILLYFLGRAFFGLSLGSLLTHFWSYFAAANFFSILFGFLLFLAGRNSATYNPHKQSWTPQILNDLWFGPTLNPRLLGVDIKMYFYQPSLIGLQLFLLAFAEHQWSSYGILTANMILFQIFWFTYLLTHYIREEFMLTTWDIIAENFGLMLVWGDMVYLPFLYCISGWYICDQKESSDFFVLAGLTIFHCFVHYMFRSANWQKDDYRRLGNKALIWGKPPATLENKLLVSGWWGIGRHLNYTGEILVYLSIALCTGCDSLVAYLLPFSLLILLTHRSTRDDKRCREKYGKLWEQYCQKAKFAMIPFVY